MNANSGNAPKIVTAQPQCCTTSLAWPNTKPSKASSAGTGKRRPGISRVGNAHLGDVPVRRPSEAVEKPVVGQDLSWQQTAPCQDRSWPTTVYATRLMAAAIGPAPRSTARPITFHRPAETVHLKQSLDQKSTCGSGISLLSERNGRWSRCHEISLHRARVNRSAVFLFLSNFRF